MPTPALVLATLGIFFCVLQTSRADLGETRAQIVTRYGRPGSETKDTLRFTAKDAPSIVVLGSDGKSAEEGYGFLEAPGQKRIMELLLRNSKGVPWRVMKLDHSDITSTDVVWRYRQPESGWRASYTENDRLHDSIYYSLTIVQPSNAGDL